MHESGVSIIVYASIKCVSNSVRMNQVCQSWCMYFTMIDTYTMSDTSTMFDRSTMIDTYTMSDKSTLIDTYTMIDPPG
jgi:hypothetical protein